MGLEDDRDMKIAGDDFEPVNEAGADVGHEAQLLEQEKENGNLSRARRLGAIMADEVSAIDGKTDPARETEKNHALPMQRRILLAFAVAGAVRRGERQRKGRRALRRAAVEVAAAKTSSSRRPW